MRLPTNREHYAPISLPDWIEDSPLMEFPVMPLSQLATLSRHLKASNNFDGLLEALTNTATIVEEETDTAPDETDEGEEEEREDAGDLDFNAPFGRCPVCNKPLRPRDRYTGQPKAPPVGRGRESRAKCDSCQAVIDYVGNGKWMPYDGKDG